MAQYEFRKLKSTDLFLVLNLVKKLGLNNIAGAIPADGFKEMFIKKKKDKTQNYEAVGRMVFDVAQLVIEKLTECEKEVYDLFEATSNLSREELENLEINTFVEMIVEFCKKEEFRQLFTRVASLSKTTKQK